jgi:hypothetical protein
MQKNVMKNADLKSLEKEETPTFAMENITISS